VRRGKKGAGKNAARAAEAKHKKGGRGEGKKTNREKNGAPNHDQNTKVLTRF